MSKPRLVKDYDKLDEKVKEQIKLVYPAGFEQHLVSYTDKNGQKKLALPFETDDVYYLVRMTVEQAQDIILFDDDYDDDGFLRDEIKADFLEKYDDVEYLAMNSNEDNDLSDF